MYLVPAFCPRSSLQTVATEGRSGILSFSLLNMYLYLKLCLYLYLRFHISRLATQLCWPNRTAAPIENARRSLGESSPSPPGLGLGAPPNKVGLAIALLNVEGTRYTKCFLGSIFAVFNFLDPLLSSKVDEGDCTESRVSYCRLPSPHTTCRLTQVVCWDISEVLIIFVSSVQMQTIREVFQ